jgi:hypothetical protein
MGFGYGYETQTHTQTHFFWVQLYVYYVIFIFTLFYSIQQIWTSSLVLDGVTLKNNQLF